MVFFKIRFSDDFAVTNFLGPLGGR